MIPSPDDTKTQMQLTPIKTKSRPRARYNLYHLTPVSYSILETIARYRFIDTLLIRHVLGSPRSSHLMDQLKRFFELGLVNRFRMSLRSQYIYYLDNSDSLRLLLQHSPHNPEDFNWQEVKNNRERDYATALYREDGLGQLLFLRHKLMVSRFHAMLEIGCRHSQGQVELKTWKQEPETRNYVTAPKVRGDQTERLPHFPDAFFTLRFPHQDREESFFYEADRKTTSVPKYARKLRAHYQFVVEQKKHRQVYAVPYVRAVLTETLDRQSAERLGASALLRPALGKDGQPWHRFWFTHSGTLAAKQRIGDRDYPRFIREPGAIFETVWRNPVNPAEPRSLLDPTT